MSEDFILKYLLDTSSVRFIAKFKKISISATHHVSNIDRG